MTDKLKLMKVKMITLDAMDKHPLYNINNLVGYDKYNYLFISSYILQTNNDKCINEKFNSIINEKLFNNDLSKYLI